MSEDVVIRVEGLGKKYVIGHQAPRGSYLAFRDVLARSALSLCRKTVDMARGRAVVPGDTIEEFWALKDVSFEVSRGEILGIIGSNGAGKSTLLKVLSRITEPDEGRVTIHGRIASLLEVGTGFHPELTGRENIFLNGAILGMTQAEIRRKFDEIVAFAEIEKFLDTPVKRYSSGMYVRLAFAVAAHLDPEILVIDEVLAVGDVEFQKKCLGKVSKVAESGRTVLFVSHNLDAVRRICSSALVLSAGRIQLRGAVDQCVDHYLATSINRPADHVIRLPACDTNRPHLVRIEILDKAGQPLPRPRTWDYVNFRIFFYSPHRIASAGVVLYISTESGTILTMCSTSPDSSLQLSFDVGENYVDCHFPSLLLSAGVFLIGAALTVPRVEWLDRQLNAGSLTIDARDIFGSGLAPVATRYPIPMDHQWRVPERAASTSAEEMAKAQAGEAG